MSRFQTTNDKGENFVYGFDRPLCEYFIMKVIENDDWVELVGFPVNRGTKNDFLDVVEKHNINIIDHHMQCLCLDLPFANNIDEAIEMVFG